MIIAIDGPAGSGKSTVARILAERLGFLYLDTGAMYRALTLKILENNIDLSDLDKIIEIAKKTEIQLFYDKQKGLRITLDGLDVTEAIRKPLVNKFVSDIAKIKEVRQIMLERQRQLGRQKNSVVEGRDIGTVVFPEAERKFYLDAEFSERVRRRYKELKEKGEQITEEEIEKDLKQRDKIDSTRQFAPLRKAPDAIYIDTTSLSIEEVVNKLLQYLDFKK